MFDQLLKDIDDATSIALSTHRQCDGDGLGAQLGLFHALNKCGKKARVINVDELPKKYEFLSGTDQVEIFEGKHSAIEDIDLCLIFDTNDKRLLAPLYEEFEKSCKKIVFIDHHPILKEGPSPTMDSVIDIKAASTGEMAYQIIKGLNVELDVNISQAIYTSIVFDTQIFRYVRNSAASHLIAAELLPYIEEPGLIHQKLFGNFTTDKIAFISKVLGQIQYYADSRLAVLNIKKEDLETHNMHLDDSRDVIDMVMNIESLEAAVLFREDGPNDYKLSLRSKGKLEVLEVAEQFGGGGHKYSSGAYVKGELQDIQIKVTAELLKKLGPS